MKKTLEYKVFNAIALIFTTLFALVCLLPMLYTLAGSFMSDRELFGELKLIPRQPTLDAYKQIFQNASGMLKAYGVTIFITVVGTGISVVLTTMTAYVLYRRDFGTRSFFAFFFYFTTLFSGGLVPMYVWMSRLGLRNTIWILMTGGLLSNMYIIMVRSFMTGNVPQSLVEAAKIDGANDFRIYWQVVLPSSGSIIATIALMTALAYWNNWYTASIYITDKDLYPLMYYLYKIFNDAALREKLMEMGAEVGNNTKTVGEAYKMAMTIFTMGPVVLLYPFFQRYFVSGVTIGAVKE